MANKKLYRPRFVRHRIGSYAASTAGESWFCRTAAVSSIPEGISGVG